MAIVMFRNQYNTLVGVWPKVYDCLIDNHRWEAEAEARGEKITHEQMVDRVKGTCSLELPVYLTHLQMNMLMVSVIG